MRHWTFDGLRLFTKPDTAAEYALDNNLTPKQLQVLQEGRLLPATEWEQDELAAHMRDQAPPL